MIRLDLPKLYPKQAQAVLSPKRFSVIESGTKAGKSLGCAIWLVEKCWNNPGVRGWWTAPVYRQTEIGFERCASLLPRGETRVNRSKLVIEIANGSVIEGRSAERADNLFGEGVNFVVVDEASRMREDSWNAIRTTLTQTRGMARIVSNPKGKKNWFYRLCQIAKDPLNEEMEYFHLETADNPHVAREEVESARHLLPRHVFEELYLGVAQEDVAGVFRRIERCTRDTLAEPAQGRYYAGVDLAKYRDYTVICVVDADCNLVHFDRFAHAEWSLQKARIKQVAHKYNAQVLIDSTGVGDPILEDLRSMGLNIEGYRFTSESKKRLIEALAVAIENEEIHFPHVEPLVSELELFEYQITPAGNVTYGAPDGYNDDCVIALALANWMSRTAVLAATQGLVDKGDKTPRGRYQVEYAMAQRRRSW